ncbi:15.4 kDa class V heat shock protein [Magnolia sinica]|uniref:15.4 kDa class V heat shock protein n=1 Tax=Magnolia sinica TaxID=86752 RepID=UPI0026590F10|nr:15.4 kDa class V heat shock protein [Magnolia sinica]
MELNPVQPATWSFLLSSPFIFPPYNNILTVQNYVHWTETPESHLFSVNLPGVKKEEIRIEVEDSRYLIIRTERTSEATELAMNFMRKFRLPERVDLDGISAGLDDGVLTITVPRSFVRGRFRIDPADFPDTRHLLARAA